MKIRSANASDAPEIATIWNPVVRDTAVTFNSVEKTPSEIAELINVRQSAGHAFLVAESDAQILGFSSYSQFRAGVGYAKTMEHTVIVAPQAKGKGIGRFLMVAVEDHARANGAHTMFAGVSGENTAGIDFHKALGYVQVAVLPEVGYKFGRWMNLHLMQKEL